MNSEERFLIDLAKYILHNRQIAVPIPTESMDWQQVARLADIHGMSNLVFYLFEYLDEKQRPSQNLCNHFQKRFYYELSRCYQQMDAYKRLQAYFEKEGIYLVPVKGVLAKRLYQEPDMRTMGDIDILTKDTQHKQIRQAMSQLGFRGYTEGRKHDHYYGYSNIQVEVHRYLLATESQYFDYYENIWERVHQKEGYEYVYEMSLEDEFIYNFIHLVQHFLHGGISIRFIMDVYQYNHIENMDFAYLGQEFNKLGLSEFYKNVSELAERWFGIEGEVSFTDTEMLEELECYILGTGSMDVKKKASTLAIQEGGRFIFLYKAFFPGLKSMQTLYPWLKKYPVLLPVGWGLRAIRSLLFRRNNIKRQIDICRNADMEYGQTLKAFYDRCGIK